jgi:hypothetical protein
MISLKVQCSCGQKVALDVDPVNGRMPSPLQCPACGQDLTPEANEQIAAGAAAGNALMPAPGKRRSGLLLGIGIAALVLLLLVGGVAFWVLQPALKEPAPPAKPAVTTGIGLFVGRDQNTGQFVVRRTFPNSPAAKAGIEAGLILLRVDGVLAEEKNITELSRLLVGPVGSKVVLEFIDPKAGTTNPMEIIRQQFENRSK